MSEIDLNDIRIASPCSVPWDSMKGSDTKRYCSQCHLNVYNISNMTTSEAVKLVGDDTAYCFSLYRRKDGTVITRNCPVGVARLSKYAKMAFAVIGSCLTGSILFHHFIKMEVEAERERKRIYEEARWEMGAKLQAKGKVVIAVAVIPPGIPIASDALEEIEIDQSKIPLNALTSASLAEKASLKGGAQIGEILCQQDLIYPTQSAFSNTYRLRLDESDAKQVSELAEYKGAEISDLLSNWIRSKLK